MTRSAFIKKWRAALGSASEVDADFVRALLADLAASPLDPKRGRATDRELVFVSTANGLPLSRASLRALRNRLRV